MAKIEVKMELMPDIETGKVDMLTLRAGIDSLSSLSEKTTNPDDITYGVIANSGEFTIVDGNGEIENLIKSGKISSSNVPVEIYVNNKLIQSHITTDSSFDVSQKKLKVNLTNSLSGWDNIQYPGFRYPLRSMTAYDLLSQVLSTANLSNSEITEMLSDVHDYLNSINIEYPHIDAGTLRQTVDKICVLAQICCYKDDNNKIRFKTARPIRDSNSHSKPIRITNQDIMEDSQGELFVKNNFNAVNITEKKVLDNYAEDALIAYREELIDKTIKNEITSDDILYHLGQGTSSIGGVTVQYPFVEGVGIYAMIMVRNYYQTGSFTITEEEFSNISKIDESKFDYSLNYTSQQGSCYARLKKDGQYGWTHQFYQFDVSMSDEKTVGYGKLQTDFKFSYTTTGATASTEKKLTDESYIKVTDNGNETWTIYYKILVAQEYATLEGQTWANKWDYIEFTNISGGSGHKYVRNVADNFTLQLYGAEQTIVFEDVDVSDYISSTSVIATVPPNELLQDKTTIDGTKISEVLKRNIHSDYNHGIKTRTVHLFCSNMYYSDGTLAKNWSNGEILSVGDLVFFTNETYSDGSPVYWLVTSRNFKYDGEPYIELQLQEVLVDSTSTTQYIL